MSQAFNPSASDSESATIPRKTDPFVALPESHTGSITQSPPASLRPPAERGRAVLLVLHGSHPGQVFTVYPSGLLIGRSQAADITTDESTASWEHLRLVTKKDGIYAQDLATLNGSFVNDQRVSGSLLLSDGDYLRLGGGNTIFKFSMMEEFEENALRTLFELSSRDSLTRLHNRRYLEERLQGELGFAQRQGTTPALLAVTIDDFEAVIDQHGQQMADVVLKLVASSIHKMMHPEDVLARYAREQFVMLARAASLRNMQILGERICHRVAALSEEPSLRRLVLSVSVGVACPGSEDSAGSLLAAALGAAASARAQGGNRLLTAPWTDQRGAPPKSLQPKDPR